MKGWNVGWIVLLLVGSHAPTMAARDRPRSYLLSLVNLPVGRDGAVERFTIATWGVTFRAVCRIPYGWRIRAGNSLTPAGDLDGEGSHGSSWFRQASPPELGRFVLVTLYAPVQVKAAGPVPATFAGRAYVSGPDDDDSRAAAIGARNVRLTPASRCP